MTSLPRSSLCLDIPKTGSSYVSRFFDAADWLEIGHRCGRTRLAVPNRASIEIVRRLKRHGPAWGNLSCRAWDHHAGYSSLPPGLQRHPKLCALRDVRTWYCSYYLYPPVAKHFYPNTRSSHKTRGIQAVSACGLSSPPVRLNHPSNRS